MECNDLKGNNLSTLKTNTIEPSLSLITLGFLYERNSNPQIVCCNSKGILTNSVELEMAVRKLFNKANERIQ